MHAKLTYNNANAENTTLHISVLSLMILMCQKKTTLNLKSANIRDWKKILRLKLPIQS